MANSPALHYHYYANFLDVVFGSFRVISNTDIPIRSAVDCVNFVGAAYKAVEKSTSIPQEVLIAEESMETEFEDTLSKDEVVNCICRFNEENGLMIQVKVEQRFCIISGWSCIGVFKICRSPQVICDNSSHFVELHLFYLQCDVCLCWQHAACFDITESTLPKKYICYVCENPPGNCY